MHTYIIIASSSYKRVPCVRMYLSFVRGTYTVVYGVRSTPEYQNEKKPGGRYLGTFPESQGIHLPSSLDTAAVLCV